MKSYKTLFEKYSHLFAIDTLEPFTMFGFECNIGWYDILERLMQHIDQHYKKDGVPVNFKIVQIKEKFGGLRFYVQGADAVVHALINITESTSFHTCEYCGSNQNIMRSTGWITTACENCTKTVEKLIKRNWVKEE